MTQFKTSNQSVWFCLDIVCILAVANFHATFCGSGRLPESPQASWITRMARSSLTSNSSELWTAERISSPVAASAFTSSELQMVSRSNHRSSGSSSESFCTAAVISSTRSDFATGTGTASLAAGLRKFTASPMRFSSPENLRCWSHRKKTSGEQHCLSLKWWTNSD